MFGDGSDGPLNVTSGTTNLNLNHKYQYTTVNVASGATLSTTDTTGSVLYILATESITIDGSILLNDKLKNGQFVDSITIDGETYTVPSTGNGGKGGDNVAGAVGGNQGQGFGGGGAGLGIEGVARGGHGGNGGPIPGVGGAAVTATTNNSGVQGNTGGVSAGGSGSAFKISGANRTSGKGGNAYGGSGGAGTWDALTYSAGSGGGGGGIAGKSGIHLVLKAPEVIISGTVNLSGTDGGFGGSGGTLTPPDGEYRGSGGGGGGGGNSGNVFITTALLSDSSATYTLDRGFGLGGGLGYQQGGAGSPGVVGQKMATMLSVPYPGPFVRVWDGSDWIYTKPNTYNGTRFAQPKINIE